MKHEKRKYINKAEEVDEDDQLGEEKKFDRCNGTLEALNALTYWAYDDDNDLRERITTYIWLWTIWCSCLEYIQSYGLHCFLFPPPMFLLRSSSLSGIFQSSVSSFFSLILLSFLLYHHLSATVSNWMEKVRNVRNAILYEWIMTLFLCRRIRLVWYRFFLLHSRSPFHSVPIHLVFIRHNKILGRGRGTVWQRKEQKVAKLNRYSFHFRTPKVAFTNVNTWKMSLSNNYSLP